MNLNNHKIPNFMNINKFKSLFMGILLIAITFSLMVSNTNGPATVFAQKAPCQIPTTITISGLPGQTKDATTKIIAHGDDVAHGMEGIEIPGIGTGIVNILVTCPQPQP
ncbi:MAG: hypothetical protein ACTHKF_11580 [Candidatus Nitrosocosmicus sp.]